MIYKSEGVDKLPTKLQAYLVGKAPDEMETDLASRSQRLQSQVVNALSKFLYETTELKKWPWSKCDDTLAQAGYELKLLPGARSVEETFKMPSSNLNSAKLVAMKADLKDNLIQLVPLQRTAQRTTSLDLSQSDLSRNQIQQNQDTNSSDLPSIQSDTSNQTQNHLHDQIQNIFNRVNTNIVEPHGHIVDPLLFGTV
ncbi:uncharacterized protein MELLADRAFT_70859 [Melampsora larici-populina 98AG31]|uniref:Uncharacterized protein n=1 Tax=Melampsora larici-populina (strain 98AG31 / pathotype 3-4-7) TaxID=747676 RepID=F4R8S6_MELLP|nr:uncharacterized protein MELLADRAFT_70859 [Melampsora larici-populina 98AG31]EGG10858.1 hypothetical protein MELLADRAFT_70859 [Melampsora larici-populina 98AG31]